MNFSTYIGIASLLFIIILVLVSEYRHLAGASDDVARSLKTKMPASILTGFTAVIVLFLISRASGYLNFSFNWTEEVIGTVVGSVVGATVPVLYYELILRRRP